MATIFHDMRYYNIVSNIIGQNSKVNVQRKSKRRERRELSWSLPAEDWIKMNVDASRRQCIGLTSIGYIMRNNKVDVIMATNKILGDYPILMVECEAEPQAIIMLLKRILPKFVSIVTLRW